MRIELSENPADILRHALKKIHENVEYERGVVAQLEAQLAEARMGLARAEQAESRFTDQVAVLNADRTSA